MDNNRFAVKVERVNVEIYWTCSSRLVVSYLNRYVFEQSQDAKTQNSP